ncbi:hypothetical protein D5086_007905 [Populus alba]|uniref:Uncharacterized protein n=1 Tax=Populus alba TaxID=43335 RepID=A0ACC4CGE7_POPAL
MNFRGNWEIPTRELHAPPFIPMFTTDREYLDSDFEEEYPLPSPRSVMCCRIVAIIVRLPPSLSLVASCVELNLTDFISLLHIPLVEGRLVKAITSYQTAFPAVSLQRVRQIKDLNEPIEIKISECLIPGAYLRELRTENRMKRLGRSTLEGVARALPALSSEPSTPASDCGLDA